MTTPVQARTTAARDLLLRTRAPGPVALAAAAAGALVLLAAVASPSTGVSASVVRIAELALAGGAAYLIDDAAAEVTVAVPRNVWRRRLPTLAWGVGALAAAWIGILVVLHWQGTPLPVLGLTGEVVVLCCLAVAAAEVLARRGEPEPGGQVGPAIVLLGVGALIAEPLLRLAIFIPEHGADDAARQLAWMAAGILAVLIVRTASRDPASRALSSPQRRRR